MAFTMNKLFAGGNLVRDPELRYIPSGSPVCTFDLALNRAYTTQAGEKREDVCFLTVVVWGKQAETCGQHLAKGRTVLVEGHLQQRTWETPEGQKRSKLELVAERVQFVGPKPGNGNGGNGASAPEAEAGALANADEVPF
jgi:single-strand DNA-binding protein